jgi:hypothetical protein
LSCVCGSAPGSLDREETRILEALDRTLSEREIRLVLARGLRTLGDEGQKRLLERMDAATATALRAALEQPSKGSAVGTLKPGKEKLTNDWQTLWNEWRECIADSGSEHGKFICQEDHWDPPYLDLDGVMQELDRIAARMHELLARVWDDKIHPDLDFADTLNAAALEIGAGLPEWSQPPDPGQFGYQTTSCLFEWQWRMAKRDGVAAAAFFDGIRQFEESLGAGLDNDAIANVAAMFDEANQRDILSHLAAHRTKSPWADALSAPYSGWFRLYQRLARKWDRKLLTDIRRDNIARDFTLALPLLTDSLRRKAYGEAQSLVDEAVRAILRLDVGKTWDPQAGLLVRHREILMRGGIQPAHIKLLGAWRKVAVALGQQDVSGALDLQLVVATKGDDWDAVLAAFRDAPPSCEPLFADWRAEASERSIGSSGWMDRATPSTWIYWLVDAARAGNAPSFLAPVREWLADPRAAWATGRRPGGAFATLALDVDGAGDLKRRCPTLHRLLSRERGMVSACDAARRS